MEREIITIDEELCNGCGDCVPGCPEGALQIIEGKARLINDLFCDGLGACIGECPVNAITIEKREAVPYDEEKTMENIVKHGDATVLAHLEHLKGHNEIEFLTIAVNFLKKNNHNVPAGFEDPENVNAEPTMACGCPGSMEQDIVQENSTDKSSQSIPNVSELSQWPIQLQLLNSGAPYFKGADLLIAADCVPFSYPAFHSEFLKNKKLIVFCPKLDTTIDSYIQKLEEIFSTQGIKSITIAHMEVPCCFGVEQIVKTALKNAGKDVAIDDITIAINGTIK